MTGLLGQSAVLHKYFKPFVEDKLPALLEGTTPLLATPGSYPACPKSQDGLTALVIGPEGGFIPYEVEKLIDTGCRPISLGPRIMRVETAVTAVLAKLF